MRTEWLFVARPQVELTSSRRPVGVVAHRAANAVDVIVNLSAMKSNKHKIQIIKIKTARAHIVKASQQLTSLDSRCRSVSPSTCDLDSESISPAKSFRSCRMEMRERDIAVRPNQ